MWRKAAQHLGVASWRTAMHRRHRSAENIIKRQHQKMAKAIAALHGNKSEKYQQRSSIIAA